MRLNVGRYGNLTKSTDPVGDVNQTLDMSQQEFESERRSYGGYRDRQGGSYGGQRYGGGGGSGGGGNRDRSESYKRY